MVKLAMYKGKGSLFNSFIRLWTRSEYSHCEIVVEQWSYSSSVQDKGVRRKLIEFDPDRWDFIDLPWVDARDVEEYFKKTDHHKYGLVKLIFTQLFNLALPSKETQFCSEWCANSMGLSAASIFSPKTLGETAEDVNRVIKNEHKK